MAHYPGPRVPPYYPTNTPDEARAAYNAWSDHYARWPYANPSMQAPSGTWHYTQTAHYPHPAYPVHPQFPVYPPGFQHYGWGPPQKENKQKKKMEDSDDDDAWQWGTYTDAQGWGISSKKKKVKDDDEKPWVGHYVPAGHAPSAGERWGSDGRGHYNWQGRTAEQVQADRHRHALASGVYTPREKIPRAKAYDQFWVVGQEGEKLVRFDEIEAKMKGKWKVDERDGSSYFVNKGEKDPKGWGPE